MTDHHQSSFADLSDRSREVFLRIVEGYLETGSPMGSRALTRLMSEKLSAATIRNVMQDLEFMGLLGSPHVSAGRVPTEQGLRFFVDGLLEIDHVDVMAKTAIEKSFDNDASHINSALDKISSALSGVTDGASLVLTPKREAPIKHIEFVLLAPERALIIIVFADGHVENRFFEPPAGQTPSSMREAANFLNAMIEGYTLSEVQGVIAREIKARRQELDQLAAALVEQGVAIWDTGSANAERLIVRGRSNLLLDQESTSDLARVKSLFDDLERKRDIANFLELTNNAEGVRIFIGSENKLFSLSGSSLVVSPYMNAEQEIIGAVGVIGPTRLNYGRIVPIVNYTAQLVGKLIAGRS